MGIIVKGGKPLPWPGNEKAAEKIFQVFDMKPKKIESTNKLVSYQGEMHTNAGMYGFQILLKPYTPTTVYFTRWDSRGDSAGSAAIKDPQTLYVDQQSGTPVVIIHSPCGQLTISKAGIHSIISPDTAI